MNWTIVCVCVIFNVLPVFTKGKLYKKIISSYDNDDEISENMLQIYGDTEKSPGSLYKIKKSRYWPNTNSKKFGLNEMHEEGPSVLRQLTQVNENGGSNGGVSLDGCWNSSHDSQQTDFLVENSLSNSNQKYSSFADSNTANTREMETNIKVKMWNTVRDLFNVAGSGDFEPRASDPLFEDTYMNIKQLATKYKYTLEDYQVQTEDGYILTVQRLSRAENAGRLRVGVFLMHGALESADGWLLSGPNHALAYVLADRGFDVWLGNARGSKHSRAHAVLTPTAPAYWRFSWDEVGRLDLPAMLELALRVTGLPAMHVVAHSAGASAALALLTLRPEMALKVRVLFTLAPAAYMRYARSPLVRVFGPATAPLAAWLAALDVRTSALTYFNKTLSMLCTVFSTCNDLLSLTIGPNNEHIPESLLPVIYSHMPSDTSTMHFVHYGQLHASGRFCRYDHGDVVNRELYGVSQPPDYDLNKINTPVVVYYGGNDWLSNSKDVELLISKLPNVYNHIYIRDFNNLDFLYAEKAVNYIYGHIIEVIDEYEKYVSTNTKSV